MKKPTFRLTYQNPELLKLVKFADKKTLAQFAIDCTERVMPFFENSYPNDLRPRNAINTLKEWMKTGEFHMAVIRKNSLDSHKAAKDIGNNSPASSAAHAAGQTVATAHVQTHAMGGSLYALQAMFRASTSGYAEKAVEDESRGQTEHHQMLLDKKKEV